MWEKKIEKKKKLSNDHWLTILGDITYDENNDDDDESQQGVIGDDETW